MTEQGEELVLAAARPPHPRVEPRSLEALGARLGEGEQQLTIGLLELSILLEREAQAADDAIPESQRQAGDGHLAPDLLRPGCLEVRIPGSVLGPAGEPHRLA